MEGAQQWHQEHPRVLLSSQSPQNHPGISLGQAQGGFLPLFKALLLWVQHPRCPPHPTGGDTGGCSGTIGGSSTPSSCSPFIPHPGWCPSSSCPGQSGGCWQEQLLQGNGEDFCVVALEGAEMVQATPQAGRGQPGGAGQGGGTGEELLQPLGEGRRSRAGLEQDPEEAGLWWEM